MSNYQLSITFSGSDIRLTINDAAQWAPGQALLMVGASANAPQASSTVVQNSDVHFTSADGKTSVDSTLTISVSTSIGTLTLRVVSTGVVTVKSPADSFVDKGPGPTDHVLKLR